MGYCERHDTVYAGEECPACAEGGSVDDGLDRPAEGPVSRDEGDERRSVGDEQSAGSAEVGDRVADRVEEALDGDVAVETEAGDVVVGDQSKSADRDERVEVDESETVVDRSEVRHDERTVVNDSVVNRSNVGGDDDATVDDSVVNRSNVGGENGGPEPDRQTRTDTGPSAGGSGHSRPHSCPDCGAEVSRDDAFCTSCGTRLPDGE
jgi:hypothetical protein